MPWHVSAFFPAYEMTDVPPTPVERLLGAARIGRAEGLRHVYVGNVPPREAWEDTACPACGRRVIARRGFAVVESTLADGRCPGCGAAVAGVWN